MQTDAQKFFQGLGERFGSENDLSDITYAMCRGSKVFFQFFLDFFFRDFNLLADEVEIARERPDNRNKRPDFRITTRYDGSFYVEVKKWDGNQHFDDYFRSLRDANCVEESGETEEKTRKRLGYIVNYELPQPGYDVHQWKELVEQLKRYDCFNDDTIRGYAEYVKNVCGLEMMDDIDEYKFNLEDFEKIRGFMADVDHAIEQNKVTPRYWDSKDIQWNRRIGRYFSVPNYRGGTVWGWIGCWVLDKQAEITVEFLDKSNWGSKVCEVFRDVPHDQGELSVYYHDYEEALYFDMTERDASLASFFKRVLETIATPEKHEFPAYPSVDYFRQSESLLAIRRFPQAIQKHFFANQNHWDEGGWVESTGVEANPRDHIHVTFKVHAEGRSIDGWVGVDYLGDATPTLKLSLGEKTIELQAERDLKKCMRNARMQLQSQLNELEKK